MPLQQFEDECIVEIKLFSSLPEIFSSLCSATELPCNNIGVSLMMGVAGTTIAI